MWLIPMMGLLEFESSELNASPMETCMSVTKPSRAKVDVFFLLPSLGQTLVTKKVLQMLPSSLLFTEPLSCVPFITLSLFLTCLSNLHVLEGVLKLIFITSLVLTFWSQPESTLGHLVE